MKSYGNTGTPITMDMGGFHIQYREPINSGNRASFHKTSTMLNAVAEFNTLERTSGFDTPLRIERMDIFGNKTHVWTLDGRYAVPRLIAQYNERGDDVSHERDETIVEYRERRRYRRYSKRSGNRSS